MTASQGTGTDSLAAGWTWWTGELASMVPGAGNGTRRNAAPGLLLTVTADGLRLADERSRKAREPQSPVTGDAVWDRLSRLARSKVSAPLTLRLAHSDCFIRRVELPEALRSEARRFLDLDLERATPFRLKDVYADHYVAANRAKNGMLIAHHVVVRRDRVDHLISGVEASGFKLTAIDCLSEDGAAPLPINLLASREPDGSGLAARGRASRRLMLLAGVLAFSGAYISLSRHEAALSDLQAATVAARAKNETVQQSVRAGQDAAKNIQSLLDMKSAGISTLKVLDGVTRLIPDSAWLTDLRIDADVIEISGQSESAAPLISAFETSGLFEGAAFTAPVTRDADGKERFAIKMRIKGRRVAQAPAGEVPAP